ncbi:MAG: lambda exonuclease family protein [Candidatus Margulisiibacteriota bacterium]
MSNELQKTDEWFSDRLGCVTASRVSCVMAKTKTGESASRKNYMMQLLCERLTGKREESFTSSAMQRGVDLEPVARVMFEMGSNISVIESGFIKHPNGLMIGASPDGLCDDDAILEIKCPNTAQYVDFLLSKKIPRDYELQMRLQMACANADHAWFVMYDDRMPSYLQLTSKRLDRDIEEEKIMMEEIIRFLEELDELEIKVRQIQDQQ